MFLSNFWDVTLPSSAKLNRLSEEHIASILTVQEQAKLGTSVD
jgi:hypothetical protein